MKSLKLLIVLLTITFNNALFAYEIRVCDLNPELFYFSTADQSERLSLVEFAVVSNERFNMRSVPLNYIRGIINIKPQQINAGYVVQLMQKGCPYPLGFYSLKAKPEEFANQRIELQLLYIHTIHTRQGLGTRLLKRAAAHAKKLGMRVMNLYSMPESQNFYAKHGAIKTGSYINLFYPEGKEKVVLFDFDLQKFNY